MMRALSSFVLALLLVAPAAEAQMTSYILTGFERDLSLSLSPNYPKPGETVLLSIETASIDLDRSTVVWYVNDEEIARGAGLAETTIQAGAAGQESRILVVAQDDAGLVASAEATIRPAEVDLLWEALSYAHSFYEGRPLPGPGSPIRAHAIARFVLPDGSLVPESDIIYTWYRNNDVAAEGRGLSSVVVAEPTLYGVGQLRVLAQSADRSFIGEARASIRSTDPFALFYEKHPLFGILYHRALQGSVNTLEIEQQITAVPYFMSALSPDAPSLAYHWQVNGIPVEPDPSEPQTLTITAEGFVGAANISLDLTDFADALLHAASDVSLVFGDRGSFFTGINPFTGTGN